MTLSQTLARFVARSRFADLSDAEVAAAKVTISDCVGCAIAGSVTDTAAIVRRVAQASSADGAATVIGGGQRGLSAQAAALANATAAHALDYDDILWTLYGHPSATILSASLAVAETVGAGGRDLIHAYVLGVELAGKLGRSVNPLHYEHGWHATASIGVIAATAACVRLMRLDEAQIAMALGIAASEACGVRRNFGTMTKPFHAGNAARGAVLAAELAREGFTSDLTAIEGEFGWARTLNARSVPDAEVLQMQLGKPWEISVPGIVLKRYPACGGSHCGIDAFLGLQKDHAIQLGEIDKIVCHASPFAKKVLLYPRPRTGLEGKFSMEFCLAVAAIDGRVGLCHFDDAWARDPRVTGLIERIGFESRADLEPDVSADAVPAEVTVHARGRTFSRKVLVPSGDPRNPMNQAERLEKFLDCTGGIASDEVAQRLFDDFERLDQIDLVASLATTLRGIGEQREAAPGSSR